MLNTVDLLRHTLMYRGRVFRIGLCNRSDSLPINIEKASTTAANQTALVRPDKLSGPDVQKYFPLSDFHRRVGLHVFLIVAPVVGDRSRCEIDIVPHDAGAP